MNPWIYDESVLPSGFNHDPTSRPSIDVASVINPEHLKGSLDLGDSVWDSVAPSAGPVNARKFVSQPVSDAMEGLLSDPVMRSMTAAATSSSNVSAIVFAAGKTTNVDVTSTYQKAWSGLLPHHIGESSPVRLMSCPEKIQPARFQKQILRVAVSVLSDVKVQFLTASTFRRLTMLVVWVSGSVTTGQSSGHGLGDAPAVVNVSIEF